MKLTCLGTGAPESHVRRVLSGYLVEVGEDKILLDCGGGVVSRLIEVGTMPREITHLFFTHLHSEHMMDYARLIHAAWDEGHISMPVWGPAPLASITDKLFGKDVVFATDLTARCDFSDSQEVWVSRGEEIPRPWPSPQVTEISAGFHFQGDGWTLSTCEAPHAQPYLGCLAFHIEAEGKSLVYLCDSALCPPVTELCQEADLLIHWCYRLSHETDYPTITEFSPSAGEIAQMAQPANIKRLFLTHIRKYMDMAGHLNEMQAEARTILQVKLPLPKI